MSDGEIGTTTKAADMVDVSALFQEAANSLTMQNPLLCNSKSFNLQDAMAALELLDEKMDCCEIPASQVAPMGVDVKSEDDRKVFPRPAPTGLDDVVDPLPWKDVTLQESAFICLKNLVRLDSLLSGASVVESIYTCLFAHAPVMADMKARLTTEGTCARQDECPTQCVVYASTLLMLELSAVFRSIILNADIYEEEDFTVSTYSIQKFDELDDDFAVSTTTQVVQMLKGLTKPNQDIDNNIQMCILILEYQLDLLTICTSLARIAGKSVRSIVEQAQTIAQRSSQTIDQISELAEPMLAYIPTSVQATLRRCFDSHVNRPLVGNAPVRKIFFRSEKEALLGFVKFTKELDWGLCRVLLKADSLGRIRRMLSRISVSGCNIVTRSLLVLNLYFDDKLFGQHPLTTAIKLHIQQSAHVPDECFKTACTEAFLSRLAKPIYDTLKLKILNRNRQRVYVEAVMLHEWASLRREAYIVDADLKNDGLIDPESVPVFSIYVLVTTIELMDLYVNLAVELKLCFTELDLTEAYWYRDFLLSSLVTQVDSMRKTKMIAKRLEAQRSAAKTKLSKASKKKNGKNKGKSNGTNTNGATITPEDLEDDFDFLALNMKRNVCRGIVRFLAAIEQAGFIEHKTFDFTDRATLFQRRFEAFAILEQPPALNFDDFVQGTDFSGVKPTDLIHSTGECFTASKTYIDKLLSQQQPGTAVSIDNDYLSLQEGELKSLARVCIGNAVYIKKLEQAAVRNGQGSKAKVSLDLETNVEFCTLKIS